MKKLLLRGGGVPALNVDAYLKRVEPGYERKYCPACGQECLVTKSGRFSVTTGRPELKYVCPSGLCHHMGIDHAPSVQSSGLWAHLNCQEHCPKCGMVTFTDT